MRSFRQIIHGCKKHKYRLVRQIRWYEDEYDKECGRSGFVSIAIKL